MTLGIKKCGFFDRSHCFSEIKDKDRMLVSSINDKIKVQKKWKIKNTQT